MFKKFSARAWDAYLSWQREARKTLNKINDLLKSIMRNGYDCEGKPEPLMGKLSGYYSVRIDKKNRLIFKIEKDAVKISQCGSHYGDK